MILVGYGSNDNSLGVWEKLDLIVFHSDCRDLYQRQLTALHQLSEL